MSANPAPKRPLETARRRSPGPMVLLIVPQRTTIASPSAITTSLRVAIDLAEHGARLAVEGVEFGLQIGRAVIVAVGGENLRRDRRRAGDQGDGVMFHWTLLG
jgi:hypothetical protein